MENSMNPASQNLKAQQQSMANHEVAATHPKTQMIQQLAINVPKPKLVEGYVAVCTRCGSISIDHSRCQRCCLIFNGDVKIIPLPQQFQQKYDGEKLQKPQLKQYMIQPNVQLMQPMPTTPQGVQAKPRVPRPLVFRPRMETTITQIPRALNISQHPPPQNFKVSCIPTGIHQPTSNQQQMIIHRPPANNVVLMDETNNDFHREEVTEGGNCFFFKCRTIRIGQYKFDCKEKVAASDRGIKIIAPTVRNKNEGSAILNIQLSEIVKMLYNFRKSMPVLFLYVNPLCGIHIRECLKMEATDSVTFNPHSRDVTQTKIVLYLDCATETILVRLQRVFETAPKKLEDIPDNDTDEILMRLEKKHEVAATQLIIKTETIPKPDPTVPKPKLITVCRYCGAAKTDHARCQHCCIFKSGEKLQKPQSTQQIIRTNIPKMQVPNFQSKPTTTSQGVQARPRVPRPHPLVLRPRTETTISQIYRPPNVSQNVMYHPPRNFTVSYIPTRIHQVPQQRMIIHSPANNVVLRPTQGAFPRFQNPLPINGCTQKTNSEVAIIDVEKNIDVTVVSRKSHETPLDSQPQQSATQSTNKRQSTEQLQQPTVKIAKVSQPLQKPQKQGGEKAKMLVILQNGQQMLITFLVPKKCCTVKELLEQVGVPFSADDNIQCTLNPGPEIDYLVVVSRAVNTIQSIQPPHQLATDHKVAIIQNPQ